MPHRSGGGGRRVAVQQILVADRGRGPGAPRHRRRCSEEGGVPRRGLPPRHRGAAPWEGEVAEGGVAVPRRRAGPLPAPGPRRRQGHALRVEAHAAHRVSDRELRRHRRRPQRPLAGLPARRLRAGPARLLAEVQ
eukprot:gene6270-biopygen4096